MEKLLTIIVPSYNVERYLEDVLKTYIIPEMFPLIEVLIINDGSKDRTQEIAESYQAQYPECFVVINKENGGHGSTINTGIKHARGKYIRVIDGDDWVDSQCLKNYLNKLQNIDADLVLSPFRYVRDDGSTIRVCPVPDNIQECIVMNAADHIDQFRALYMMHANTYRTEILRKIPPISEHCFYVDNEFINYPLPYINTVVFIDECVYQYRYGTEGQSVSLRNIQKNRFHFDHIFKNLYAYEKSHPSFPLHSLLKRAVLNMGCRQLEVRLFMPISHDTHHELQNLLADLKESSPWVVEEIRYWKYRLLIKNDSYPAYVFAAMLTHIRMKH